MSGTQKQGKENYDKMNNKIQDFFQLGPLEKMFLLDPFSQSV